MYVGTVYCLTQGSSEEIPIPQLGKYHVYHAFMDQIDTVKFGKPISLYVLCLSHLQGLTIPQRTDQSLKFPKFDLLVEKKSKSQKSWNEIGLIVEINYFFNKSFAAVPLKGQGHEI